MRILLLLACLTICLLLAISPGCLTSVPTDTNLTVSELADQYLAHAGTIRDYRSEYTRVMGMNAGYHHVERIRYDTKAPSFIRMAMIQSNSSAQGSFATANGTSVAWYNAESRTYDLSAKVNLTWDYDYQDMVRRIVADRNFAIIGRETNNGTARYLIEVATEPYSDKYTPYISSRIRAQIEPSTGLAWTVATYYDCEGSVPTTAPSPVGAVPTVTQMMTPPATPPPLDAVPLGMCRPADVPNNEVRYDSIAVNTGIPDSYFDFVPPEGSGPRCIPKYQEYVEPPRTDPSSPIDQPLPGGVRYSLNESDSGRTVTLRTGEVVEITLRDIPGLAYRWMMPVDGSGLDLVNAGPFYVETQSPLDPDYSFFSGKGYYRWRFRAISPGTETFDGIFALSGCDIQGADRFNLTVKIAGA
jgi:predicted secreted protein/outer membrane lipoprotein-sorting protein